jgi:hypothetical protein
MKFLYPFQQYLEKKMNWVNEKTIMTLKVVSTLYHSCNEPPTLENKGRIAGPML